MKLLNVLSLLLLVLKLYANRILERLKFDITNAEAIINRITLDQIITAVDTGKLPDTVVAEVPAPVSAPAEPASVTGDEQK